MRTVQVEKGRRKMNKKVAITGGSRGIGRGIVRRLARDGYDVSFTYSSPRGKVQAEALVQEIVEKYGVKCFAHQASLDEKGVAEKLCARRMKSWKGWTSSSAMQGSLWCTASMRWMRRPLISDQSGFPLLSYGGQGGRENHGGK